MTARFPLLAQPPAPPACCAACRRPTDPIGFFDTGLELDFWGRVYLCATDLLEMVRSAMVQLGLADRDELEREQFARRSAEKALAAANAGEAAARRVLSVNALQMVHDVTIERLHIEAAAALPAGGTDAGSESGAGAAGGGDAGGGRDSPVVPPRRPARRPARPRAGAPAGPADADGGGPVGPATEPAAGGDGGGAAQPGPAHVDFSSAPAGA